MPPSRPRLLRRRTIHKGRVVQLDIDRVRLTNGRTIDMEIVRHRGSVVLMPQPSRGHVVLIRQFRYVIDRWLWELPAGSLEEGETPAACARRECEEEIGLRPGRVKRLGALYPTPGFCNEIMIFYQCSRLSTPPHAIERDPDEQIEPRVFSLAEAQRLVDRGRIIDMKTVLGLRLIRP